jgi:tRNA modification GTPase
VLKKRCDEIYARIMKLVSTVYVRIDYPEEDLSELTDAEIIAELEDVRAELCATERTYKQGKAVSEGVKTAIIGKPNVGKSSLLNALVGEEKAIVTAHAGTTRDVIEDKINAGRVTLRLFDTAGIRDCDDEVEQIGVSRAIDKASEAELIVAVFDTSKMPDDQDERIISIAREALALKKPVIFVLNKSDGALENAVSAITGAIEEVISELNTPEAIPEDTPISALNIPQSLRSCVKTVSASAKDGTGIEKIKEAAESFFIEGHIDYQSVAVVANARQYAAVSSARMSVERALAAIKGGYGADVCGLDLEAALGAIGQVDGRAVSDEITNEIFHNFCVGK